MKNLFLNFIIHILVSKLKNIIIMAKKEIINYNLIKGIVDFVIEWYHDAGIAIRLEKREIEAIGALYGMSIDDVLDKVIRELEMAPCNEYGDTLTGRWEETPDAYILYAKPDDEDEEED